MATYRDRAAASAKGTPMFAAICPTPVSANERRLPYSSCPAGIMPITVDAAIGATIAAAG